MCPLLAPCLMHCLVRQKRVDWRDRRGQPRGRWKLMQWRTFETVSFDNPKDSAKIIFNYGQKLVANLCYMVGVMCSCLCVFARASSCVRARARARARVRVRGCVCVCVCAHAGV